MQCKPSSRRNNMKWRKTSAINCEKRVAQCTCNWILCTHCTVHTVQSAANLCLWVHDLWFINHIYSVAVCCRICIIRPLSFTSFNWQILLTRARDRDTVKRVCADASIFFRCGILWINIFKWHFDGNLVSATTVNFIQNRMEFHYSTRKYSRSPHKIRLLLRLVGRWTNSFPIPFQTQSGQSRSQTAFK